MDKKKIYVTDDDEGVQDIFKIIFEKAGFNVTIFSEGKSLLENINNPPDIFLLDKQLSGMDGLDICRTLKAYPLTSQVPVIMVSATPDIGRLSKEAGADDFIEKPFKIKEVICKIQMQLDKVHAGS